MSESSELLTYIEALFAYFEEMRALGRRMLRWEGAKLHASRPRPPAWMSLEQEDEIDGLWSITSASDEQRSLG
jgi:hypothetical protein